MEPVARPLTSLDEVWEWSPPPPESLSPCAPLSDQTREENAPRILVCHDMRGGYLEDRFIQGCSDCDAYRITHWHLIDTFVYFSHHFITIPPPGWINAAHKNGTKILGTFITEWKLGQERCDQFLSSPEMAYQLADKLVEIARTYQFDGWLINIENEIDQIDSLLSFVRYLTAVCHATLDQSQIIWYDSVTMNGKLNWQNELNEKNAPFFEACDGIFLNYTWKKANLQRSRDYVAKMDGSDVNQDGRHNIYVGLDVFGRGCMGGGGYNCSQPLDLIKEFDLSAAVFAPAWTHENHQKKHCHEIEHKFWSQFEAFPSSRRRFTSLPLMTSFCTGSGNRLFHEGKVISTSSWFNLSLIQVQPNVVVEDGQNFCYHHDDGYYGGGSLKVESRAGRIRLFSTDIPMDLSQTIYVSYVIKSLHGLDTNLIKMKLVFDSSMDGDEKWEEKDAGNGWIERSMTYKVPVKSRLQEVIVNIDQWEASIPDDDVTKATSSFLIGHLQISNEPMQRPRIQDVKMDKLYSVKTNNDVNSICRTFKVSWTPTPPPEHCSVFMQYSNNGQVVTSPNSDNDVTDETMTSSFLLGQTVGKDLVVGKLPVCGGDWDTVNFIVVPYCGEVYKAAFHVDEFK